MPISYTGACDAKIWKRAAQESAPLQHLALKGTSDDKVTLLPQIVQQQLQEINNEIASCYYPLKLYEVR
jgi:hypothetical protein